MSVGSAGYRAALAGAAVAARADRAHVRVTGRDPVGMLQGILTNNVPEAPRAHDGGVTAGTAKYSAVLTPKGRMVGDLWVFRDDTALLLAVPAVACAGLLAHLATYIPPRFAKAEDAGDGIATVTVAGPQAAALLSREAFGLRVEADELAVLAEGEWRRHAGFTAMRSGDLSVDSFDVTGKRGMTAGLLERLLDSGAVPLTAADLTILRIEAGRPAFGVDLDEETIPTEAGIDARAIDHNKGCYTGQEVIVRIRDRGHVNRSLRGLKLGSAPAPAAGTELWAEGRDQPVGRITSAATSPRAGTLALAMLRREVEAPGPVRVGRPDGASAEVVELGPEWWRT